MQRFKAYRVYDEGGGVAGRFAELGLEDLDEGGVVIRVTHSSLNYKDALAATGAGKIIRKFPTVAGIDLAGVVAQSADEHFREGDEVLATGYGLGEDHDGGYAEYARVPGDWVVPIPEGLSAHDAMALGTAGFTAALAVERMQADGLSPEQGPVIVTGATGGVGSLAIQILAALGYRVTALTGKETEEDYLRSLGAAEVLSRGDLRMGERPLEKGTWAGAVDTVGRPVLGWLTRTMMVHGHIASCGNAGGIELHTTVMPFILRGVSLLGVDSRAWPMPGRRRLWERLAGEWRPPQLAAVTRTVPFDKVDAEFPRFLERKVRGRTVVAIGGPGRECRECSGATRTPGRL